MIDAYEKLQVLYTDVFDDLGILAGDAVGPGGASWQDVAGTAAVKLRVLADFLDELRSGAAAVEPFSLVFPSPSDFT